MHPNIFPDSKHEDISNITNFIKYISGLEVKPSVVYLEFLPIDPAINTPGLGKDCPDVSARRNADIAKAYANMVTWLKETYKIKVVELSLFEYGRLRRPGPSMHFRLKGGVEEIATLISLDTTPVDNDYVIFVRYGHLNNLRERLPLSSYNWR